MKTRISELLTCCDFFIIMMLCFFLPAVGKSQTVLPPFDANKKASVSETIGITNMLITYNRPEVKGREGKIWGQLVHYGFKDLNYGTSKAAPWRAGANENTTISLNGDVFIEGKALPAGKYGFFIAMYPDHATLIFSKRSTAWGSFWYDAEEDALRVDVPVVTIKENIERLKYEFNDQTDSSAIVSLLWEKIKIPFRISVDLHKDIIASFRKQFPEGEFYRYWQNMHAAANYCLVNNINLKEGLHWANQSINTYFGEANFSTLSTQAGLFEKLGRQAEADSVMKKALPMGTVIQLNDYGNDLLRQNNITKAFDIFNLNYTRNPGRINAVVGMIRGYSSKGNNTEALKYAEKALTIAKSPTTISLIREMMEKLKKGEVISYQ